MNYFGIVISDRFNRNIKTGSIEQPYRGTVNYTKGDYCYHYVIESDDEYFYDHEYIFYQD